MLSSYNTFTTTLEYDLAFKCYLQAIFRSIIGTGWITDSLVWFSSLSLNSMLFVLKPMFCIKSCNLLQNWMSNSDI